MKTKKKLIYLVEDNQFYSDLIMYKLMCNKEYDVKQFQNGEQLFQSWSDTDAPDLIILDMNFDGEDNAKRMNGLEIVRRIKKTYSMPVVAISGEANMNLALGMIKNGSVDFIEKSPKAVNKILAAVQDIFKIQEGKLEIEMLHSESQDNLKNFVFAFGTIALLFIVAWCMSHS